MDEKYDCIVLGTGLKECIISGVLSSVAKLKVALYLHRMSESKCKSRELSIEDKRASDVKNVPCKDVEKWQVT